jgi:diguanylate cyclase (GGDEF)-like protein
LNSTIRSLFPRLESIYLTSRAITAIAVISWMFSASGAVTVQREISFGMIIFALHLAIFYLIWRFKPKIISEVFTYSLIFDVIFVTYLIKFTGGANSSFYLLYYLNIMFSAYYFSLNFCVGISFAVTILYIVSNPELLTKISTIELGLRVSFAWFFAYAVGFVARHMKESEGKLLKLLDSLNESTTELERSQVRVEKIYETSRLLGEIHDDQGITRDVLNIVDSILGFEMCSIQLCSPDQGYLYERGRLEEGERKIVGLREIIAMEGVIGEVVKSAQVRRVIDLRHEPQYIPTIKDAQSAMIVPMISHGRVIGILQAESSRLNRFTDIDQKVAAILAASAAMAYENSRLHGELEKMVIIDELTGVFNYRFFAERLNDEIKRATRYHQPLSLIMVDLDWFKRVNDTHGHEAGNMLLRGVVRVISLNIRDTDVLARYGGEEFIIILPQTDHDDARLIAERIRSEVEHSAFGDGIKFPRLKATVSVGITTYPDNGRSEDELVQLVDQAMYLAKGSGKNAVVTI